MKRLEFLHSTLMIHNCIIYIYVYPTFILGGINDALNCEG